MKKGFRKKYFRKNIYFRNEKASLHATLRALEFTSFSAYIQALVENDMKLSPTNKTS